MSDKILVVDDDLMVCKTIVDVLNQEGFKATGVNSGKKALSLLDASNWDLALLDIVMDEMDGIELLDRIREKTTREKIVSGELELVGSIAKCWLGVPLRTKSNVTGAMVVQSYTDQYIYSEKDIELMEFVSEQVASTIENKRSEEALRESEERFRKIYEKAPIGIAQVGSDLKFIKANEAFCKMLGYKEEELTGKSFLDVTHPDDIRTSIKEEKKLFEYKSPQIQIEKRFITKESKTIWCRVTATIVKNAGELPEYALSIVEDITEWKEAEMQLKSGFVGKGTGRIVAGEERFRTIFEKGPVGIALADMDGNFISVNDMYCNLLGYSKDELLKLKFIDITHEDDLAVNEVFNKKMQKGETESFSIEKRYLKKNGDTLWVNVTASQIRDKSGKPLYSMGIIEDITERRQLEKKREEAVKLAEKAARLTSLGTLAAGISHEINQPLTAIKIKVDGMLYWKNLSKEISADEVKECLEFVSEQSTRIDNIIKQMRLLNITVDNEYFNC